MPNYAFMTQPGSPAGYMRWRGGIDWRSTPRRKLPLVGGVDICQTKVIASRTGWGQPSSWRTRGKTDMQDYATLFRHWSSRLVPGLPGKNGWTAVRQGPASWWCGSPPGRLSRLRRWRAWVTDKLRFGEPNELSYVTLCCWTVLRNVAGVTFVSARGRSIAALRQRVSLT
jgi:hypothetical protein